MKSKPDLDLCTYDQLVNLLANAKHCEEDEKAARIQTELNCRDALNAFIDNQS